jgi:thiamine-phosphate pyrophosphorylase
MGYDLYVVTDRQLSHGRSHVEVARQALRGGADVIQLRDKEMSSRELYQEALEIRELTLSRKATFIVNDRLDIAMAVEADGVHLGQSDLPIDAARLLVPPWFIIGVSATTYEEGVQAAKAGAHYVGLGPIFPTGSKKDAAEACGLEVLSRLREKVSIPIVAIGGISRENAPAVIRAGADGVAVISAVVSQEDVAEAAKAMRRAVIEAKDGR